MKIKIYIFILFNVFQARSLYLKNYMLLFWNLLHDHEIYWNKYCDTREVFWPKNIYALTWSIWISRINNDAMNCWKFTWASFKEPEDSFPKWKSMHCMLSRQINYQIISMKSYYRITIFSWKNSFRYFIILIDALNKW